MPTKKLSDLIINPTSRRLLEAVTGRLPHALLLTGESGIGLRTIAYALTEQKESAIYEISVSEKGSIGIDVIRDLYKNTRTKQRQLFVIIDDADTMTIEAQNALLKLLEEPSASFHFILTSHAPQNLLHTIRSRTQRIFCHLVDDKATEGLLSSLGITVSSEKAQLQFMAGGRPAEITRLVRNKEYFAHQTAIMKDAKAWLQGSTYEKILIIQKYGSDRMRALQLLEAASTILRFSLVKQPRTHLATELEAVQQAIEKVNDNRHVKLQLLKIVQG